MKLTLEQLKQVERLKHGDRRSLAKAITLIESQLDADREQAQILLNQLLPETGKSIRIGISGVPGVGKSTFIEAFGLHLLAQGKTVAVLAVDPSSPVRGGSILGDKTRMEQLARAPKAFIRPSPAAGALGGVTQTTRETILLCEAAGYDVILVETVGVGQSEHEVAAMVDFFLVLLLPNAGDELQGIKRGIIELADALVINKADGNAINQARQTQGYYQNALHLTKHDSPLQPKVLTCSALERIGIAEVWQVISDFEQHAKSSGTFERKRAQQLSAWLEQLLHDMLLQKFKRHPEVAHQLPLLRQAVVNGQISPYDAARKLLELSSVVVT